jgi:hypothetical protein
MRRFFRPVAALMVGAMILAAADSARAHLCDNVFRQADKLVVKPELVNLIVKDVIAFKVFLQNNMDREVTQIRLGCRSDAFDVSVKPVQMSVPKDARVFFEVELRVKPGVRSGSYPLEFRLFAVKGRAEQEFKRFSIGGGVGTDAPVGPPQATLLVPRIAKGQKIQLREGADPIVPAGEDGALLTIDGTVDEPVWGKALTLSNFTAQSGKPAEFQTIALMLFDPKVIYLAVTCLEPQAASAGAADTLTIFLCPPGKDERFQFSVAADGSVLAITHDVKGSARAIPADKLKAKVKRGENEWSVEMALPWETFGLLGPPQAGDKWLHNIIRRRAVGTRDMSFWAGTPADYSRTEGFGQLLFAPAP